MLLTTEMEQLMFYVIMVGNNNTTSTQYYLGINDVNVNDLYFALTVDKVSPRI